MSEIIADIYESQIRQEMPEILAILLRCHSSSTAKQPKNIIWANSNYLHLGEKAFAPTAEIQPHLITGENGKVIMPRALKQLEVQQERTKSRAEVFTPLAIVKLQNDAIDEHYAKDKLPRYLNRRWLEII